MLTDVCLTGPDRAQAIARCARLMRTPAFADALTQTQALPLAQRLYHACAAHIACTPDIVQIAWHFQTRATREALTQHVG